MEFLEFCAELYCENFDERTAGSKKRVMEGDIQTGVVTTIRRGITALNHLRDWQNALEGQPKITDMVSASFQLSYYIFHVKFFIDRNT